jgi:broad-specificity NMP kinase
MKKLIIIYGKPASGKLTTALELNKISGYPVFHNHLTIQISKALFGKKSKKYFDLIELLRLMSIEYYFKTSPKGLVFTWFYWGDKRDINFVSKIDTLSKKLGVKIFKT